MKKAFIIVLLFCATSLTGKAQLYFTKNGSISFFSSTMLEDIKADNNQVISIINFSTGDIQFSLLNNAFHFRKALMEEHFNEDYIESLKYPKSTFKGSIADIAAVNITKDGVYNVTVTGSMNIHGVTKTITTPGTITVKAGNITAVAAFKLKIKDYNISIPSTVRNNIAEYVDLKVSCSYEKK